MKKILILFIAIISNMFAGTMTDGSGNVVYEFIVDNPAMVDAYFNIFNAMASYFSSNDYLEILKIVFLLGGFFVFVQGVLSTFSSSGDTLKSIKDFAKYLVIGVVLLTIIFSASTSMVVKTNVLPSFCAAGGYHNSLITSTPATGTVIGNIPLLLGWGFSFINEVGRETSKLAAKGFSSVSGDFTTYTSRSEYGAYLQGIGNVLSADLESLTSNLGANGGSVSIVQGLEAIQRDCILMPASKDSTFGPDIINAITNTGNVFDTIDNYLTSSTINVYKNPTISTPEAGYVVVGVNFGGIQPQNLFVEVSGGIHTCGDLWTEIKSQLVTLKNSGAIECNSRMKDYFNPQTLQIMTGDSTINTVAQGRDIALNAALANQMLDQKNNIAAGELSYAAGKSMAELVHKSSAQGMFMADMLPYLQMGMRAVLYAFFPFVFIIVLMPKGLTVLISYLKTLIWIELWSPAAAILNMFMSVMSTEKFAEMYNDNGSNVTNGLQALSDSIMLSGVAGYLYLFIPALTWLILSSSGDMISGLGSNLALDMEANLDSKEINSDKDYRDSTIREKKLDSIKGNKERSLAKIAADRASNEGIQAGGDWFETNSAGEDILLKSSRSKAAEAIYSNYGKSKTLLTPDGKNMLMAKGQGEALKNVVELQTTGEIGPGGVNEDKIKEQAAGEGVDSATTRVTSKKSGEKIKSGLGVDRTSDLRSSQLIAKDKGADKTDKLMKSLHKGLDYTTDDTFNDLAYNKSVSDVMDNEEFDKFTKETGITKKSSNGYLERESGDNADKKIDTSKLRTTATAAGAFAASEANAQVHTKNTLGQDTLNEAAKNSLLQSNVESGQLESILDKQLSRLAKNGNSQAASALNGSLADKIAAMNMSGKDGQAFMQQFSDDKAVALNDTNDFSSNQLASMEGSDLKTKILAGEKKFKQLMEYEEGREQIEELKSELNIEGKNQEERAILGLNALVILDSKVRAYENIAMLSKINEMKKHDIDAELFGSMTGVSSTIRTKVMEASTFNYSETAINALIAAEIMTSVTRTLGFSEEILLEDSVDRNAVSAEELERERENEKNKKKKRIAEIEKKGGKSTKNERAELKRLKSRVTSLENDFKKPGKISKLLSKVPVAGKVVFAGSVVYLTVNDNDLSLDTLSDIGGELVDSINPIEQAEQGFELGLELRETYEEYNSNKSVLDDISAADLAEMSKDIDPSVGKIKDPFAPNPNSWIQQQTQREIKAAFEALNKK